jgi:hypothetical protein
VAARTALERGGHSGKLVVTVGPDRAAARGAASTA